MEKHLHTNWVSGGPLTVKASDQHYLAGVVSWGYGCAADGLPGVYAEVAKTPHQTWLPVQTPAKEVEWPCNELSI